MSAGLYKTAYEEGQRSLDKQFAQLDGMRQRSVQYLAFVGSATGLLVGTALSGNGTSSSLQSANGRREFLFVLGLATLISLVTLALVRSILLGTTRLRGRLEWETSLSPGQIVEILEVEVGRPSETDLYRYLALQYEVMLDVNEPNLNKIRTRYSWYVLVGNLQLAVWVLCAWRYG